MQLQLCGQTFENTEFCFALSMSFSRVTKFTVKIFSNFQRKVMLMFFDLTFLLMSHLRCCIVHESEVCVIRYMKDIKSGFICKNFQVLAS